MRRSRRSIAGGFLFAIGLFLTTVACAGLLSAAPRRTPTALPPTLPPPPTETATPLFEQVKLQSAPWQEQGEASGYSITAQVPVLVGSTDPRVQNFNAEAKAVVDGSVATFKQNLGNLTPVPNSVASTFDLHYNLMSPPGNLLSLKFDVQTYYAGAAHPGDTSQTLTYDLQAGRDLSLADLFVPGADFLTPISKYAVAQLSTRDIGFPGFELGATATVQNYRNWNITADGLMISFDEYQVAPYAAGPQTVIIPYSQLASFVQPDGPLAPYLH